MSNEMKACDFCGEEIKAVAKKCKHCGEYLGQGGPAISHGAVATAPSNHLAIWSLGVTAFSILLTLYALTMRSRQASEFVNIVTVLTILVTAVLIAVDAKMFGIGKSTDGKRKTGPVGWGISIILLYVLVFPGYHFLRVKHGGKNFSVVAVVLTVLYMGALLLVGKHIGFRF